MELHLETLVARGFRQRLLGLAWSRAPRARALLLPHCRSVHTFGMRFALDLFWLGPDGSIVRVDLGVPPWRVARCPEARSVIEVPVARRGSARRAHQPAQT